MHLLAAQPGALSDNDEAIDLEQSPGAIVFLSAADTDLALITAAQEARLADAAHAAHAGGVPPFSERPFPVVRLRGLPYDATENDVAAFFQGLDVVDVVMLWRGQRLTGEAFVLLPNTVQVSGAP